MRQLRSCDFCGEDASGIYEVLPSELSPTEDEQRRVVLCDDCLQTLETVVDPLLARLGYDAAASRDTVVEERGESPEPVSSSGTSEQKEDTMTRRPIATSAKNTTADVTPMTSDVEDAAGRTADGGTEDGTHGKTASVDGDEENVEETSDEETFGDRPAEDYEVDEETAVEEANVEEAETAAAGTGAVAEENVEETSDEESFGDRPAEDYEVDDVDRRPSVDGDPAEDYEVEDDVESTSADEEVDDAESIEAEPEKFRKVMRLLNNRDLPVERDEFADVASGAYELDRSEVDTIIDYAIRRDVLVEEDGRLGKA